MQNATDQSHIGGIWQNRTKWDRSVAYRYSDLMEHTNSPSSLGAAIRRRRSELGITQDDLALSIGVNRKVIGQLEGGKETVWLEIALSAAHALGLDVGVEARDESGS